MRTTFSNEEICLGNGDRSPLMAGVLALLLNNSGNDDVVCESGGIRDSAAKGGGASKFGVLSGKRIGIDLSKHVRRKVDNLQLSEYDLFVAVDQQVAFRLFELGVSPNKIFEVGIPNPWPSEFQIDHDVVAEHIMAAMYRVVTRYFPLAV